MSSILVTIKNEGEKTKKTILVSTEVSMQSFCKLYKDSYASLEKWKLI